MIDWFAKSSKWRGGSTFAGHVNNIFDATIDALDEQEKQVGYKAAPLFAPLAADELASGGGAGGRRNAPPGAPAGGAAAPGRGWSARRWTRRARRAAGHRAQRAARPAGALRQPGVPARRRTRLARRPRRRAEPGRRRASVPRHVRECHRFGTIGKDYAPELTRASTTLPRRDILRSIFFPSEKVDPKYETTVVVLATARRSAGSSTSENAQNVVLKTAGTAELVAVQKAQIAKRTREKASIMPDDLADKVGDAAVRDVTAYLLEGPGK